MAGFTRDSLNKTPGPRPIPQPRLGTGTDNLPSKAPAVGTEPSGPMPVPQPRLRNNISKGAIARRAGNRGVSLKTPRGKVPGLRRDAKKTVKSPVAREAISRRRGRMTVSTPGNTEDIDWKNLGQKIRLLAGARNKSIK